MSPLRLFFPCFLVACAGGNAKLTRTMFEEIKGRPIMSAWQQLEYFEHCRDWAKQPEAKRQKPGKTIEH